jgi:general secretion pathway protein L
MRRVLPFMQLGWANHASEACLRFSQWWLSELALSIPPSIRRRLFRQRERFWVRIQGDEATVEGKDRDGSWSSLDLRKPDTDLKSTAVALQLPQAMVLRRAVDLPYAAAATLQETTSFQIARVTPFKLDDTYHVARILERDRQKKTIRAEIAVVPRAVLDRVLAQLENYNIQPSAVLIEGDHSRPPLDFRPELGDRIGLRETRRWRPTLAIAAVLLAAAPFATAYGIHVAARTSVAATTEAAKVARKSSAARSQLDALVASRSFLPDRLRGPPAIVVLDAFSRLVPDTSWLVRLELRPDDATISGFTSDLPALLQQVGTAPFMEPELTSPVVQGRGSGQSRFDIRVRYRGSS